MVVAGKASEEEVKKQRSEWEGLERRVREAEEEVERKPKKPSMIAKLLRRKTDAFFCQNPFESYLRFEGSPQDGKPKSFQVFVHTRAGRNKPPVGPIRVDVRREARIEDVCGLALCKYVGRKLQPQLKYKDSGR